MAEERLKIINKFVKRGFFGGTKVNEAELKKSFGLNKTYTETIYKAAMAAIALEKNLISRSTDKSPIQIIAIHNNVRETAKRVVNELLLTLIGAEEIAWKKFWVVVSTKDLTNDAKMQKANQIIPRLRTLIELQIDCVEIFRKNATRLQEEDNARQLLEKLLSGINRTTTILTHQIKTISVQA